MSSLITTTGTIYGSMMIGVAYALVSGIIPCILVLYLSTAAAGGGIPDIKAYLNGNLLRNFLSFRTLMARIVGVCLVTSCGVFAGPEGPMAHVGMMITVLVARLVSRDSLDAGAQFDLATVGSGIGISSAFTAPLGGYSVRS
jgi:H+/Cl- antiporter ClcA